MNVNDEKNEINNKNGKLCFFWTFYIYSFNKFDSANPEKLVKVYTVSSF